MAEPTDQKNLSAELAAARGKITGHTKALRHEWDLSARLKSSVERNRPAWIMGAALLGLLLSKIPPLRRTVVVEAPRFGFRAPEKRAKIGVFRSAVKIGLDLARPAVVFWAKRRFFPDIESTPSKRQAD